MAWLVPLALTSSLDGDGFPLALTCHALPDYILKHSSVSISMAWLVPLALTCHALPDYIHPQALLCKHIHGLVGSPCSYVIHKECEPFLLEQTTQQFCGTSIMFVAGSVNQQLDTSKDSCGRVMLCLLVFGSTVIVKSLYKQSGVN